MPKGQNLAKDRQPLENRLKQLGAGPPLQPGEVSLVLRIRGRAEAMARLLALSAKERGRVVEAGLEVLRVLEVRDA